MTDRLSVYRVPGTPLPELLGHNQEKYRNRPQRPFAPEREYSKFSSVFRMAVRLALGLPFDPGPSRAS